MFRLKFKNCFLALLGSLILAFGLYNIHSVSGVTEGGILGLTLLLDYWLAISPAISGLILNLICYFIGWRSLGRDFIGYSIFAGGGFSLFYAIFELFPPLFPQIAEHKLIAAILGAVFVGIGVGLAVRAGGAPSGDDALAMSLSRITKLDIKWIYLISDLIVLGLSLSYIPFEKIAYSLITVVLSGFIISLVLKIGKRKASGRDVLVGALRNATQLDICLGHNFYHIPAERMPDGASAIKYIAIYQSRSIFGSDAGIRYFGEVESCRLLPRNKIEEIPSSSTQMYYRFNIKKWETLEKPIIPREGGFVNITTTLFLLKNCSNTFELTFFSDDEFGIYKKICDGINSGEQTIMHNGLKIVSDSSEIRITRKGRSVFFCSADDFRADPMMIFRYIRNEINLKN